MTDQLTLTPLYWIIGGLLGSLLGLAGLTLTVALFGGPDRASRAHAILTELLTVLGNVVSQLMATVRPWSRPADPPPDRMKHPPQGAADPGADGGAGGTQ